MASEATSNGSYCLYPPRLADEVDITQQSEGAVTRYIVRNAATARYFILKQPEFLILTQFDGTKSLSDVAKGSPEANLPRVALPALIKFLGKLDSLGLLAREGAKTTAAAQQNHRGLYIKFPLFNPNRMLDRLDRLFGWAFTKTTVVSSFVLMTVVGLAMLARLDEASSYTSYLFREYGLATIIAIALTITALHEFAHGFACKHFGGDVREMGLLLVYYVLPGFYCNVTDIYRMGRKQQRLWVIFAGIYWQLLVSTGGGLIWLLSTPYTVLADISMLVFIGGSFNILVNCNPLIKLDGYYALSQALGIVNLQGKSSAFVRSRIARLIGSAQPRPVDSQRPMVYAS